MRRAPTSSPTITVRLGAIAFILDKSVSVDMMLIPDKHQYYVANHDEMQNTRTIDNCMVDLAPVLEVLEELGAVFSD